ncbi:hypothetical protein Ccrd_019942 [Cynara cardunculus var. scolymus]|uniref:Uncharacterized protein n=1 Tax=Cynara cardunculus var. scolymus TaxID=59895 RepID=A0A124SF06_CYNCS|nr:hypothetical protein Ccrd_019942 [Cynara cardunculus var. scolymus]
MHLHLGAWTSLSLQTNCPSPTKGRGCREMEKGSRRCCIF